MNYLSQFNYLIKQIIKYLQINLRVESDNFIIWLPVFLAIGILLYFSWPTEPNFKLVILIIICLLAIKVIKLFSYFNLIINSCLLVNIGFALANYSAIRNFTPIITKQLNFVSVSGVIESIINNNNFNKIVINNPNIEQISKDVSPKKIRIIARTSLNTAKIGDLVSFKAILSPPSNNQYSNFNFTRYAYFNQIGAIGYSVSDFVVITKNYNKSLNYQINKFRHKIAFEIKAVIGDKIGYIALALITGEYRSIHTDVLSAIRIAGVAHILAISGMHLSLIAAIFFIISRLIIVVICPARYYLDSKKIAAIIAICGSFAYLLISGQQVAAIRAFIMSFLMLIAIIFDRRAFSLINIALAALLIMVVQPESIITASFQMSFFAVLGLTATYELTEKYISNKSRSLLMKIKIYFFSLLISSLIASISTSLFCIYHFNQYSTYSLIANLIAIPITSFILMPLVVGFFFCWPLGLEKYILIMMSKPIELIIYTTKIISNLPNAQFLFAPMNPVNFWWMTFGILCLALLKTNLKYGGLLMIMIGLTVNFFKDKPQLIIDLEKNNFAFKSSNSLYFSSKSISKRIQENWLRYNAQSQAIFIKLDKLPPNFQIIKNHCNYKYQDYHLEFICLDSRKKLGIYSDLKIVKQAKKQLLNYSIKDSSIIYLNKKLKILKPKINNTRLWNS